MLILFHDMIADMESNKRLSPIATELFLRERKETQHFTCFYLTILFQSA